MYFSARFICSGWATSIALSQTKGDGWVQGASFEGYSYFLNISKRINHKHTLAFTVFGAPQVHNQRSYKQKIIDYKKYSAGIRYNANWGILNGEVLNVKKNTYHKPQAMLNHFWKINRTTNLSTSVYASIGRGKGTGTGGSSEGKAKFENYRTLGQIDFDKIVDENVARGAQGSDAIIYSSNNNHEWYGVLSNLRKKLWGVITVSGGVDARYYIGHHYRQVENLLGGMYYKDSKNKNDKDGITYLNDKMDYYNDGKVAWLGVFGQVEYSLNNLSAFFAGSFSNKSYKRRISGKRKVFVVNFISTDLPNGNFLGVAMIMGTQSIIDPES